MCDSNKNTIIANYGGWIGILKSNYFRVSCLLLIPTYSVWTEPGWWEHTLSIFPDLLGFTLGGFALTLAFGDEKYRRILALSGDDEGSSVLKELAATFFIFIIMQVIAIICALIAQAFWNKPMLSFLAPCEQIIYALGLMFWAFSYLTFLYGLTLSIAAAKWIYTLAITYADFLKYNPPKE